MPDGTVTSTGHPYTTRIVVRRPVSEAASNGVVLAEWLNVSNQWDQEVDWFQTHEHLMREGYTWVGVSAQRVGANFLPTWDEERYGEVAVDAEGVPTDALSYDIFAQAAQAVRNPEGVDPMGGLDVDNVLAIGASQSAGRMTIYYDAVLPQVESVFDGYGFIVGSALVRAGKEGAGAVRELARALRAAL